MNIESPTEIYTVALIMWHFQRMELKEAVKAADATKDKQRGRVERFRETLHQVVGKQEDIIFRLNGGCVEAEVDGLRFAALEIPSEEYGTVSLATLLGRCPLCGVRTMSEPFYNLAGLGKMLEKFEPIGWHSCVPKPGDLPKSNED
ncbi:MAG TPA: hypothetical protein VGC87_00070 [Pyrinomonadaceae bacterium]|jgi:hypothetical protein